MIDESVKEQVRAVLYAPAPSDKELQDFTGVKGMRQIRHIAKAGSANSYNAYVFMWKVEQIVNVASDVDEIMKAINTEPTAEEMAENSGVPLHSITQQIKNGSYGHKYHKFSCILERIAGLVDAG